MNNATIYLPSSALSMLHLPSDTKNMSCLKQIKIAKNVDRFKQATQSQYLMQKYLAINAFQISSPEMYAAMTSQKYYPLLLYIF